ncbi:LysM peptidoglycan-binding domain-containing protein [Xylanimonas sp. McL0601]|uniref:LysM peptidoglycan-binding domain-containing protein n=1 Tax=Xylanimonas sp. McL0601 TaxID=3414739 RepID=UPI003CE6C0F9
MESRTRAASVGRLLALASGLGVAAAMLAARGVAITPRAASPGARAEDWVELGIVAAAALAAAWVALGATLGLVVVGAARAGVRWRSGEAAVRRLAPGVVRRLVRAGVGVGVGAGLALGPATAFAATPVTGPAAATVVADAGSAADGLDASIPGGVDLAWQPTAVVREASPSPASAAVAPSPPATADPSPSPPPVAPPPPLPSAPRAASAAAPGEGTVVVLRGDTLWGIAARSLGGEPTDAQILEATVRWYDANRGVIGADPDLVLPGQILVRPS